MHTHAQACVRTCETCAHQHAHTDMHTHTQTDITAHTHHTTYTTHHHRYTAHSHTTIPLHCTNPPAIQYTALHFTAPHFTARTHRTATVLSQSATTKKHT
eukprot:GDKI01045727.1.p1 GENE.GDKI01045727.1~~GDKI01045727.1.p1  ORF type:complete len:100 (-),score=31.57 GDKI01045727.1:275-574(-)